MRFTSLEVQLRVHVATVMGSAIESIIQQLQRMIYNLNGKETRVTRRRSGILLKGRDLRSGLYRKEPPDREARKIHPQTQKHGLVPFELIFMHKIQKQCFEKPDENLRD